MALDSSAAIKAQADLNPTDAFPATYNLILYWFSTGAADQVDAHLGKEVEPEILHLETDDYCARMK